MLAAPEGLYSQEADKLTVARRALRSLGVLGGDQGQLIRQRRRACCHPALALVLTQRCAGLLSLRPPHDSGDATTCRCERRPCGGYSTTPQPRAEEVLGLDIVDLDLDAKTAVVIGKGGTRRPVNWYTPAHLLARVASG